MRLAVDPDELAACVSCGLCLPHCPTYRVTGEESASPRGRIAAMRVTNSNDEPPPPEFSRFMDLCVQCRGCETACPSSVAFGHLMEGAKHALALQTRRQPPWRRKPYGLLGYHRLLLAASSTVAAAQRLHIVPERLGLPWLPLRRPKLHPSGSDAWLFVGCVMDAWLRPVHQAALSVMEAVGEGVALPGPGAACCGALHLHAGLHDEALRFARRVIGAFPGAAPVVVDSAGCGAVLRDYGRLLDTPEASRFSSRVIDIHEWLAKRLDSLPRPSRRLRGTVAVQDPCHLRHVQRGHRHVRTVLAPFVDLSELDDDGLCCGAGGAYASLHPDMADKIRELKLEAISRTGAGMVASANPGCMLYLEAAGVDIRHPVEIVAWALGVMETWRRPTRKQVHERGAKP